MAESFFEGRRGWLLVYCLCIVGFGYLIYTFDDLHSCALRNNLFGKTPSLKVKEIYNITKARPPALFKINLQVLKEKNSDHPFPKYSIWGKHRPSRRTLWSCSYKAWKQGNRQKVIVYSVVGGIYKNSSNIEAAMEEVAKFYPGWKVWVYGEKFNRDELSPVLKKYRQLFLCDVEQLSKSLAKLVLVAPGLWRVVPMGDMQIDVILSRDINAKIIPREVAAVNEFLKSGKTLHVMRDHPWHGVPIVAGTFGIRQTPKNRRKLRMVRRILLTEGLKKYNVKRMRYFDQYLLSKFMYLALRSSSLEHDSYSCKYYKGVPFPTQRDENKSFVGMKRNQDMKNVSMKCPIQCRPKNHKDWKYC